MRKPVDLSAKLKALIGAADTAADLERVFALASKINKSAKVHRLREDKLKILMTPATANLHHPDAIEKQKEIDAALCIKAMRKRFASAEDMSDKRAWQNVITDLQLADMALLMVPGRKPKERATARTRTLRKMRAPAKAPRVGMITAQIGERAKAAVARAQAQATAKARKAEQRVTPDGKVINPHRGRDGRAGKSAASLGRKQRAIQMRAQGKSAAEIMAALDISTATLYRYFA